MSTRKQVVLSIVLLAVAAGAVVAYTQMDGASQDAAGAAQGHDHGAAAATDQASPVRLTAESARRIGVTYATAERAPLPRTLRAVGVVSYDETRLASVNPKIEGWVERLYVDFTGAPVRRGQPLLDIYSPRLVSAQEELILARRLGDGAAGQPGTRAATNAEELVQSARRRLAYWDIPADEIARIEDTGEVRKTLTLRAPAGGIVVEKNVVEGTMIGPGMNVYRIADLSRVWVEAEVFEKDLSLVHLGQHARVTFEAYRGEDFDGVVTYVYPTVSLDARTGRMRLELRNPDLRLRPGMYANVELAVTPSRPCVHVPRSAVLFTGERAIVFVRSESGTLVPREVTTGLVAGELAEIRAGLAEGEVVVSSATFLIDAESNLGAAMGAMAGMEAPGTAEPSAHEGHDQGATAPSPQGAGAAGLEGHTGASPGVPGGAQPAGVKARPKPEAGEPEAAQGGPTGHGRTS